MSYTHLSTAYDTLMGHVDYDKWLAYINQKIKQHKPDAKLVLDLACGTGTITTELDYEMIGIDQSYDMLNEARAKAKEKNKDILFLNQDMREFELYGTVDVIICSCDSLNYILEADELFEVFRLVENYLDPHGLFIFDINTTYKYETLLADNSFSQAEEEAAMIWENYYDEDTQINEYYVTIFSKTAQDLYERSEEYHYQKAYTREKIETLIKQAKLELISVTDEYTDKAPTGTTERLTFIAREAGRKSDGR